MVCIVVGGEEETMRSSTIICRYVDVIMYVLYLLT